VNQEGTQYHAENENKTKRVEALQNITEWQSKIQETGAAPYPYEEKYQTETSPAQDRRTQPGRATKSKEAGAV